METGITEGIEALLARVKHLEAQRDECQATSNRDLQARREAMVEATKLRRALAFARSAIKCGEPWDETCEREIGDLLK
jgi:hypothetical protein